MLKFLKPPGIEKPWAIVLYYGLAALLAAWIIAKPTP